MRRALNLNKSNLSENRVRYLEMIQAAISRTGTNSFALKSWTVTLVAGILALAAANTTNIYVLAALLPVVVFWILDAYYLQLERTYRSLFDSVRTSSGDVDFDMDLTKVKGRNPSGKSLRYSSCLWSKTEWPVYLPIGVIVMILKLTHLT